MLTKSLTQRCISAVSLLLMLSNLLFLSTMSTLADEVKTESPASNVLVVFVFDKSCKVACTKVRPSLNELKEEYGDRVEYVELDVSKDCMKESEKTAKSLHVYNFLQDTEEWYPAVGVFSARRKLVKQILGTKTKEMYKAAIEKAIADH